VNVTERMNDGTLIAIELLTDAVIAPNGAPSCVSDCV
jgi:hypothetical protein